MPGVTTAPARRLLLDTNVVVGALLWRGPPWQLMEVAIEGGIELSCSPILIAELEQTLGYPKFARRLALLQAEVAGLVRQYQAVTTLVDAPSAPPRVVPGDRDDDHVVAAALAARADLIVSGDQHLLGLGEYEGIAIVTVRQALDRLGVS